AFEPDPGVVSRGAVGYDIGCGVRLLSSFLTRADLASVIEPLADALFRHVPCGVGSSRAVSVSRRELDLVLTQGAAWGVKRGTGFGGDLERCEEGGTLRDADPDAISDAAKQRGRDQ